MDKRSTRTDRTETEKLSYILAEVEPSLDSIHRTAVEARVQEQL